MIEKEISEESKYEIVEFEPDKAKQFRQSNALIEAAYRVTLTQKRLLITTISTIRPEDSDFKEYKININRFADIFKIKGKSIYEHVRKATDGLLSSPLKIIDDDELLQTNWISSARYKKGSPFVMIRIDPNLKKHLLQLHLKGGYTKGFLEQVIYLNSIYAIRFYELFAQYIPLIKKREFKIEEIKAHLGIKENEYTSYGHFKDRVLNRAIYEVNSVTNLEVDWPPEDEDQQKTYEIKEGKKVKGIVFNIRQKSIIKALPDNLDSSDNLSEKDEIKILRPHPFKTDFGKAAPKQEKVLIPPTREEFRAFCNLYNLKDNKNPDIIYDSYSINGWRDAYNNPIKNWKLKILNVWVLSKKDPVSEKSSQEDSKPDSKIQSIVESIRTCLNFHLGSRASQEVWQKIFNDSNIKESLDGFTVEVNEQNAQEALNYQNILKEINVSIIMKPSNEKKD